MLTDIFFKMIYCFIASLFFALIMNSPKNVLIHTSIIASLGYLTFLMCSYYGLNRIGFFLGTLLVALLGEISARKLKMPATIFMLPGIVPIVPGIGLYQTILALVQNDIALALETGVNTILNIGAMAVALAFISLVAVKLKIKPKKSIK